MTAAARREPRPVRHAHSIGAGRPGDSLHGRRLAGELIPGEPRTTRDVDIVLDPTAAALRRLVARLREAGYYASPESAEEALARRTQFNVVDPATGWKADLIILGRDPFSQVEFERRLRADLPGGLAFIATAEDTIIAKLVWARQGESDRQLRDVASIIAVSGDHLDRAYLERWIGELDLSEAWTAAQHL